MKSPCSLTSEYLAKVVRRHAVKMVHDGRAGHIGAALSCVDILSVLYADVLQINPKDPYWENRDRFVLSKGHAGVALYATLAERGFFPLEELDTYYKNGSTLSGHVSHKGVPGVEVSTGRLGHGIGIACGMALAGLLDKRTYRTFVVTGDGELNEGAVWETVMFASQHRLSNFTVIVDRNGQQAMGACSEICDLESISKKFLDFGWDVMDVNGHDHTELRQALTQRTDRPICVVAQTIKGFGVSFMENKLEWHYKTPNTDELNIALAELV